VDEVLLNAQIMEKIHKRIDGNPNRDIERDHKDEEKEATVRIEPSTSAEDEKSDTMYIQSKAEEMESKAIASEQVRATLEVAAASGSEGEDEPIRTRRRSNSGPPEAIIREDAVTNNLPNVAVSTPTVEPPPKTESAIESNSKKEEEPFKRQKEKADEAKEEGEREEEEESPKPKRKDSNSFRLALDKMPRHASYTPLSARGPNEAHIPLHRSSSGLSSKPSAPTTTTDKLQATLWIKLEQTFKENMRLKLDNARLDHLVEVIYFSFSLLFFSFSFSFSFSLRLIIFLYNRQ